MLKQKRKRGRTMGFSRLREERGGESKKDGCWGRIQHIEWGVKGNESMGRWVKECGKIVASDAEGEERRVERKREREEGKGRRAGGRRWWIRVKTEGRN